MADAIVNYLMLLFLMVNGIQMFGGVKFQQCYESKGLINGCSVPWDFTIPYKKLFTLACDYHDVCYSCAAGMSFQRSDCDAAFLKNMGYLCEKMVAGTKNNDNNNNGNKRFRRSSYTYWQKIYQALKGAGYIGMDLWQWVFETPGSMEHCMKGATIYFHAVTHYSMDYFHEDSDQGCDLPCAQIMGNPVIGLNRTASD